MIREISALIFLLSLLFGNYANAYEYELHPGLTITSTDGTNLSAHLYVPIGSPGETFPVVIFANSWALGESEYDLQAELFAESGYIALAYTARGWYNSTGLITAAGPKDMQDISAIVDYVTALPEADINNIGMTGVSYGGGLALLAAAHEPRLKTVVSFSGWTNLVDSLYGGEAGAENGQGQETLRTTWSEILIFSGQLIGNMDPEIEEIQEHIKFNTDIAAAVDWALIRSAETYIDTYNARKIPVYMIQNMQDQLFQVTQMERFFSKLTYDAKRLDINRGIHITGEIGGFLNVGGTLHDFLGDGPIRNALVGIVDTLGINLRNIETNGPWKKAHHWFDHHLKGITIDPNTGTEIMAEEKVQVKNKIAGISKFKDWVAPKDSINVTNETYYFDRSRHNIFSPYKNNLTSYSVDSSNYTFYTGRDTDASTEANDVTGILSFIDIIANILLDGIQLSSTIGGLVEAHVDTQHRTANIDGFTKYFQGFYCPFGCFREAGVRYDTSTFTEEKSIIGSPLVRISVAPHDDILHMMAYMYEIPPSGPAKLITHGPVTRRDLTPTQTIDVDFNLVFTHYTTEPGSKIAVVFDSEDPLYQNAGNYNRGIKVLHGGNSDSHIMIPFANNAF